MDFLDIRLPDPLYPGWTRTSRYVPVRDGTLLALDVFRPSDAGVPIAAPLPVLFRFKRYQRAVRLPDGEIVGEVYDQDRYPDLTTLASRQDMRRLVQRGYVVVSCDMRGTGASFGTRAGVCKDMSPPADAWDGRDIIDWIAAQPWCDGNVGMFGLSYEGRSQLEVAATAPAALRAIMPEAALIDWYQVFRRGGIFEAGYDWPGALTHGDLDPNCAPVDEDHDGSMLRAAQAMHRGNGGVNRSGKLWSLENLPFRDSWDGEAGRAYYMSTDGFRTLLPEIARSGIAVHHIGGWFALSPRWHSVTAYAALAQMDASQLLLMGDWGSWCSNKDLWTATTLRFFDHWLKGIDSGLMDGPPVRCCAAGGDWRAFDHWPPREAIGVRRHFGAPSSGEAGPPMLVDLPEEELNHHYVIDYSIDTAYLSVSPQRPVDDFAAKLDAKALVFTSAPLDRPVELTGYPIARLHVSSDREDFDIIIFLEHILPEGVVAHVTEGRLRASHRALNAPPFPNEGRPWHRSFAEDVVKMTPDLSERLDIELLPTSYRFPAGHRIRVAICGSHVGLDTPRLSPPPTITLHSSAARPSAIELPLMPIGD